MISESFSTLWTRWNLRYSVNFSFGISPNILEPFGSRSYRSHLFIYLFIYLFIKFIYLFISFHDVWLRSGKSHLQVLHVPGSEPRPLSVLYEKRNGTLDFLTASGNNCQGIWRSSGNSLLVLQFFFVFLSQSSRIFFALGASEMETKVVWNAREVFNHWNPETQMSICLVQHKATDWPKSIVSLSQPIRTPTQNQ